MGYMVVANLGGRSMVYRHGRIVDMAYWKLRGSQVGVEFSAPEGTHDACISVEKLNFQSDTSSHGCRGREGASKKYRL